MVTGSIVAASLGGLGLFLVGSWLAGAGLGPHLSRPLRERGPRWSASLRGAFLTGLGATVALGWSGSFALSVPAFARRWQLPPQRRAALLTGSAAALALLPLLMWVDSAGWLVRAAAFTLVGAGALLRLVRPRHAILGEGLAGHGLALLGLGLMTAGLAALAGGLNLPGARGAPITALFYVLAGAGLGYGLRSPAAAVVVAVQAAAAGLTDVFGGAALMVGAGASLGLTTLELGRMGDAEDGAGAAGQAFLGGAFALVTGLFVFVSMGAPMMITGLPGGSYGSLSIVFLGGLATASAIFLVLCEPVMNFVRHRLNATRPPSRGPYTPGPLEQSVPALLIEGLGAALDTVMTETRKLAQTRLHGGRISKARMEEACEQTGEIAWRLEEVGRELTAVRWSGPDMAQALGALRATQACARLIDQLGAYPESSAEANQIGLQREVALAAARLWSLIEAATRGTEVPLMEDFRALRDLLDQELLELSIRVRASLVDSNGAVPAAWPAPAQATSELVTHLRGMVHTTCELAEARSLEDTFEGQPAQEPSEPEQLSEGEADPDTPAPLGATAMVRRPVRIRGGS